MVPAGTHDEKVPHPEDERERLLREIRRRQAYRECESIQGQDQSGDLDLVRLIQDYEQRWGPVPPIDTAPQLTPYSPP